MKKLIPSLLIVFAATYSLKAQNNNSNTNAQGASWKSNGNAAISSDFIGTTNMQNLVFKTNNYERAYFDTQGNFIMKDRINPGLGGGEVIIGPGGLHRPVALNPIAAFMLKVGGSGHFEGQVDMLKGVIEEYLWVKGVIRGPRIDIDSIKMDSTKGIYGQTKIFGDVQIKQNLTVDGNSTFNGDLIARQGLTFDGTSGFRRFARQGNYAEVYTFGTTNTRPTPELTNPCIFPSQDPWFYFGGRIQLYDQYSNTALTMGSDGVQSNIDASGGSNKLLINYYCGKDVGICVGNEVNSSNGRGGVVRMGHNVMIGHPFPSTNYDIALNVNGIEQTGLFVRSNHTTNPYNYGVVSAVNGDDNKAFAVLLQNSNNNKESVSLNANGSAHFGGDQTTMPTFYVSPSIVNNQFTVGKVGIGTNAPTTALTVKGEVTISDLGDNSNVRTLLVDATGKLVTGTVSSTTATAWNMGGNNITNAATEWFGTSSGSNQPLDFYTQGIKRVRINSDGSFIVGDGSNPGAWNDITGLFVGATNGQQPNVGIGTAVPSANLEIQSRFNENAKLILASKSNDKSAIYWAGNWGTGGIGFGQYNNEGGIYTNINSATPERIMRFGTTSYGAQVWIGDHKGSGIHSDARLSVDGKLIAKSIYVTIAGGEWADYVFNSEYKLKKLEEVEDFYKKNKHLPEIPSAGMVEEKGINVAQMNKLLLLKIEELTLYLVEQNKDIEILKKEIEELKK